MGEHALGRIDKGRLWRPFFYELTQLTERLDLQPPGFRVIH